MRCYRVGGSVRDELLGLPDADRDWVVVGATPAQMQAQGFQPVGKDFPVFLHPRTREEYALARTERKTGPGYKGFAVHFAPGVTLEEDLARRDLTINAMARAEDGTLVDPFGGERDLRARVLRHVGDAFAEDPVRILRLARFAARFPDFTVAPETMQLMRAMTAAGEVDALVAERVWQELARGLLAAQPSRMLVVLADSGALAVLLPEVPAGRLAAIGAALDRGAGREVPLEVRVAILFAASDATAAEAAAHRLRIPNECRDAALLAIRELAGDAPAWLRRLAGAGADDLLALLGRCDAWRRPARVERLIATAATLADVDPAADGGLRRLRAAVAAARVDQGAIARAHPNQPDAIRLAIEHARRAAIADALARSGLHG